MTGMDETPVLIVGGGPVGLALAADLGRRGIACMLVEQTDGTIYHPRANTINSRTMEFCRRWGIAEEVRQAGTPPDFPLDIMYLHGLDGLSARARRAADLWRSQAAADHARTLAALQPAVLRSDHAQARGEFLERPLALSLPLRVVRRDCGRCASALSTISPATGMRRSKRAISSPAAADGVPCRRRSACAGRASRSCPTTSTSFSRSRSCGRGTTKARRHFISSSTRSGSGPSLIELDGDELWRLGFSTGQKFVAPEQVDISGIIEEFLGPHIPYELISVLPWTCRSIVADTWRRGNVFLAGDAVHQHSPSGGFGMNTGLGDAVDLAWKLAAAIDGLGRARRSSTATNSSVSRSRAASCARRRKGRRPLADASTLALINAARTPTATAPAAPSARRSCASAPRCSFRTGSCWVTATTLAGRSCPDGTPAPAESVSQLHASGAARFARATCVARTAAARRSIFSATAMCCSPSTALPAMPHRSARRRVRAACRAKQSRSTIPRSPRSTSGASSWCGRTGMFAGAPMPRPTIRSR